MFVTLLTLNLYIDGIGAIESSFNCKSSSNYVRQEGESYFEVVPWEYNPVELEQHLIKFKEKWGNLDKRRMFNESPLLNSEVSRYMDTVITPFLDTYHRNIQNTYQQFTDKILKRINEEINAAVAKKNEIYKELTELADRLQVPGHFFKAMCNEERRAARSIASKHVAQIYQCNEEARTSLAKIGKYADEISAITKKYMQATLEDKTRLLNMESVLPRNGGTPGPIANVTTCLRDLSRGAVALGYELDLSLTNARRHNEHSCDGFVFCIAKARKSTEDNVANLKNLLNQCVYA